MDLFIFGVGLGSGIFFIFLSGEAPSFPTKKKNIFIKMGETSPVCREHIHTSRLHTRIGNSIFKNSNVMSFQ